MSMQPGGRPPGAFSLRELGGIALGGAGRTAPGRVLRSAAPERLREAEIAWLDRLPLQYVMDLRRPQELPDPLPAPWQASTPARMHCPLVADHPTTLPALVYTLLADASGRTTREHMLEAYREMPLGLARHLERLFDVLTEPARLPLLVHCSEGKDRTGFVCALLLLALGADRDTAFDYYLLGREHFDRDKLRTSLTGILERPLPAPPADAALDALTVDAAYLQAALDVIDREYGSLERYLHRAGRLTPARRDALCRNLLV